MGEVVNLENRTLAFSRRIVEMCKNMAKTVITIELIRQIIRSGTSVGANYREANEGLSKNDLKHRIRIARKEAKETTYWLEILLTAAPECTPEITSLMKESRELRNILSAILSKL